MLLLLLLLLLFVPSCSSQCTQFRSINTHLQDSVAEWCPSTTTPLHSTFSWSLEHKLPRQLHHVDRWKMMDGTKQLYASTSLELTNVTLPFPVLINKNISILWYIGKHKLFDTWQ